MNDDSAARKRVPLTTGCLDYFPDALKAVARLSLIGNDKHNPGEPLHWSREKSADHADCITRHMTDRGTVDDDGELHEVKVAWRALAQCQIAEEERLAKTGYEIKSPAALAHITAVANTGTHDAKATFSWSAPKYSVYSVKLWYVATPYSDFAGGHLMAFELACKNTATLMLAGVPVFSPIAHSHPLSVHGGLPLVGHNFWVKIDAPLLAACDGLIVVQMAGWEKSRGVAHEIAEFTRRDQPIVYWDPAGPIPGELAPNPPAG